MYLIVSLEVVPPTLRLAAWGAAGRLERRPRPEREAAVGTGRPRNPTDKGTPRASVGRKATGVAPSGSTRPGYRRGDSLSRSGATSTLTPVPATHPRLRTHTASAQSSAVHPLLKHAPARPTRRERGTSPREMKSDTPNTHAPQWRTTHARLLRARARLRQLHRQRQVRSSRNG